MLPEIMRVAPPERDTWVGGAPAPDRDVEKDRLSKVGVVVSVRMGMRVRHAALTLLTHSAWLCLSCARPRGSHCGT
jgi:hypothetical protein